MKFYQTKKCTLLLLVLLHRQTSDPPLLQLGRRYEAGRASGLIPSRLPPMVIIFTNYLQNIPDPKRNASLCTGYKFVFQRIVVKLCADENLQAQFSCVNAGEYNFLAIASIKCVIIIYGNIYNSEHSISCWKIFWARC